MRVDILALQKFYASPLGEVARAAAVRRLSAAWESVSGLDLLGYGYATPYLPAFLGSARRVVSLMPAEQGVERWPTVGASSSALVEEARLPLMDSVFDRVLLVHALEECEAPRRLLREIWRVMAPEGRLVVIAANRAGLWALRERTPFGHGRPYSRTQLSALLSDCMFEPLATARALYTPPIDLPALASLSDGLERAGGAVMPAFGGLILMEAVKRLEAVPARPTVRSAPQQAVVAKPVLPKRRL